ncbi:MAG TPA: single-stranded DNA-binding protein, partial [Propionicimonas sp.]|nr:single-stranded DNA-binding protein [Propionicimonas sp.]
MAIQTQQSFSGFVASDPQLSRTENGDARLYMKVGKEHYRQEQDGSFTQLETTFHNLVAFKAAAEQGHERLAKGDKV